MRTKLIAFCLFPFACAWSFETDEPAALGNVQVTATRGEKNVREIATAVTVVDTDAIRQSVPQVLPEVLRGQIGTYFQQTTPGQGTVIVRGLKGSQILHLVDGMRLNNAFFRDAPNQYLALIDPFNTNRIEVVRGPGASLYGADAMGGVIQILTPEHRMTGDSWSYGGNVYAGWGSADLARIAHADFRTGKHGFSIAGGLSWQDYGNRDTRNEGRISDSGYDSKAGNLKILYDINDRTDLMFDTQYLEQPKTPRIDELHAGFGQVDAAAEQFWFKPNRREFYHGRLRYKPDTPVLDKVEIHFAQQKIVDDRRTQNFADPIINNEFNDSELNGFTAQFDSTPGPGMHLTYGLEIYTDDIDSGRNLFDSTTGVSRSAPGRFPDGSSMDSIAAYLHNEWQVSSRWLLSGGLRYSEFDIDLDDPVTGQSFDLKPDKLTGNLSANFLLTPGTHLVANLSRGFRPPNIFDLGTFGPRPGNRFNIANQNLDSETVNTIDFGIKAAYPDWNLEAFVFYSDYDDKITSVATGAITADGRTVVHSENINKVRLYGLEFGAAYELSNTLELYGVLNYTRGEEDFSGGSDEPADRIPPLNGKLGIRYRAKNNLSAEPFVLFADNQHRLSTRDVSDPRIDPNGTAGWATVNVDLSWNPSDNLQWIVRLENLFDKGYREHGSGIDAAGRSVAIALNSGF